MSRYAIIVTGPQGCGKTRNAARLQDRYGCSEIVDDWTPGDPVHPHVLHLTNHPIEGAWLQNARVIQFSAIRWSEP